MSPDSSVEGYLLNFCKVGLLGQHKAVGRFIAINFQLRFYAGHKLVIIHKYFLA